MIESLTTNASHDTLYRYIMDNDLIHYIIELDGIHCMKIIESHTRAQAQSEAATSADVSADHMRAKMMLTSELESARAALSETQGKFQSSSRGAEAEVQALVNENVELNRSVAITGRDMTQLEAANRDLTRLWNR